MEQSFSLKNFRSIYDTDLKERGGLEREYFESAYNERLKIRRVKRLRRKIIARFKRKSLGKEAYESRIKKVKHLLDIRKERYNNFVNSEISNICKKVNQKGYKLPLERLPYKISEKDAFTLGYSLETIFITRHLISILKSVYSVRPSHRDVIVSRLRSICVDQSPKYIIKADVETFYEQVDHKNLINKLHSSTNLSVVPKRLITQLLKSYSSLTGCDKGLPRGVGLSAYLSELYMKEVDDEIQNISDLTFYSRYVDDLILSFSPNIIKEKNTYLKYLESALHKKNLMLNSKTKCVDLTENRNDEFEYLGYKFVFKDKDVSIGLSDKRVKKYKSRIDHAFSDYIKKSKYNPNQAGRLLVDKFRFLTGNTRLLHAKSKAFTGVYFNNMFINDVNALKAIDDYYNAKVASISNMRLLRQLKKFSFVDGFKNKIFRSFSADDLKNITRGWKNV